MSLDQEIRKWLDVHEETSYVGGESTVCDDPDGGLLRYSGAIRGVLEVHASVSTDPTAPTGLQTYWCQTCLFPDDTQCPTVRGIAAALGVGDDQHG